MPARTVTPSPASGEVEQRPLWLVAAWTGVGAAAVCATLAIAVVAICWLPVSGVSGHATSAVRAGLLTFLAALHGGVTVDGTAAQFVPLGMTAIVAVAAWRAGAGLAAAAAARGEREPSRLATAALVQAASFTACAVIAVEFAQVGSSHAALPAVIGAGLVLFLATGGLSFLRASEPLSDALRARLPRVLGPAARGAAGCLAVYAGAGSLLLAGSLALHASRVEYLARQVAGGWGGVPVLLLGLLSIPNAVIAAAGYLAGPGFAIGTGTTVSATASAHGVLPAFPILGAVPQGHGATPAVWLLMVVTPLVAGAVIARTASRPVSEHVPWSAAAAAVGLSAATALVLAWLGGGGIGGGRLRAIGASPWQVAIFVAVPLAVACFGALGLGAAWSWLKRRTAGQREAARAHGDDDRRRLALVAGSRTDAPAKIDDRSNDDPHAGTVASTDWDEVRWSAR